MRRGLVAGLLLALAAGGVARADDASQWLARMSFAMESLNYRGEFVHAKGSENQTLAIVHRVEDGQVHERLWSLDGPAREIVRNDKEVKCIFADSKQVVVEPRATSAAAGPAFPIITPELQQFYDFVPRPRSKRVAGRTTRVLEVKPRDPYRFGYRLYLDDETSLPLRSDLLDRAGEVIEKLYFIHVSFPAAIPASDLEPELSYEGFDRYRRPAEEEGVAHSPVPEWVVGDLPRGFRLESVQHRPGLRADSRVEHLVYTDGLASVSVFIETLADDDAPMVGLADTGNVYGTLYGRSQVTVMGDVPVRTLRRIGRSARPVSSL